MTMKISRLIFTAFLVTLLGCAAPINGLYQANQTALDIQTIAVIEIDRPEHEKKLQLRAILPSEGGPYPLIVLSHGTFSSNERYDLVAEYWAQNGYTVIIPQHLDANYGITPKSTADMVNIVATRVADMRLVLDELDRIVELEPRLAGKIAKDSYIAAGHSIGTLVAMRVTGLIINDINTNQVIQNDETRYASLVLLSDPGKMRQMPLSAWTGSVVPTFMSTGTEDYGLMGAREEPTEGNEILSSNDSVDRIQLLLQDGDHYFGGLVQKEVDAEPDHEGLDIFNKTSVAFLDAYIKNDRSARRYLESIDLPAATNARAELIREPATN